MTNQRPKIKIESDATDRTLKLVALIGVILMLAIPAYFYLQLPDQIPIHFGSDGKADGFGNKAMIWLMPVIGVLMYLGLSKLATVPHVYNYATKITEDNAHFQYKKGVRLIRFLNAFCMLLFTYVAYSMTQPVGSDNHGISPYFTPIISAILIGVLGNFIYQTSKGTSRK